MAKKNDDLKEMPVSELTERLENTREELFNMRFQLARASSTTTDECVGYAVT